MSIYPFEADKPAQNGVQTLTVEIKQLFSWWDVDSLCELAKGGKIELLENLIVYNRTGAVYAHFKLKVGVNNR